jgi:inositol 1,4,5-triphosphate receptor type 3
MIQCFITYFNHGVRSGGGIGDILTMRSFTDIKLYTARYLMDMIFYITVILLLLNMVNGVIVTTFSQIRQERETKEEDKENKCFICSINRLEFEKRKISFEDHNNKEHSYKTYIKYLLHLNFKNEDEMDYDESYIYKSILKKDVGCFPIKRAFSIGRGHETKDEEEED